MSRARGEAVLYARALTGELASLAMLQMLFGKGKGVYMRYLASSREFRFTPPFADDLVDVEEKRVIKDIENGQTPCCKTA